MTDRDPSDWGGVPAGWSSVGMTQPRGTGIRRPFFPSERDGHTQGYSDYCHVPAIQTSIWQKFLTLFGGEANL